jgi:hypothetical protein
MGLETPDCSTGGNEGMTPLTTPADEQQYVPLAAYLEQGRALEALQETAAQYKAERDALRGVLAEGRTILAEVLKGAGYIERNDWGMPACNYCGNEKDVSSPMYHAADCAITKARTWLTAPQSGQEGSGE